MNLANRHRGALEPVDVHFRAPAAASSSSHRRILAILSLGIRKEIRSAALRQHSGRSMQSSTCTPTLARRRRTDDPAVKQGEGSRSRFRPCQSAGGSEAIADAARRRSRLYGTRAGWAANANGGEIHIGDQWIRRALPPILRGTHTKTPWHSTLVLIRHGQSEWNAANRFTGWTDIDLTDEGRREAAAGAEALRDIGISRFDRAFTSELARAQETLDIVLSSIGQPPWRGAGAASALVRRHWRLNERHYGALQGRSKLEMIDEHGREQVRLWRQSFDAPPPPVGADDARHPGNDAAYARVPRHLLPRGECLRDTQRRVMPYWQRCIAPELRLRGRVLVAAHGHSCPRDRQVARPRRRRRHPAGEDPERRAAALPPRRRRPAAPPRGGRINLRRVARRRRGAPPRRQRRPDPRPPSRLNRDRDVCVQNLFMGCSLCAQFRVLREPPRSRIDVQPGARFSGWGALRACGRRRRLPPGPGRRLPSLARSGRMLATPDARLRPPSCRTI